MKLSKVRAAVHNVSVGAWVSDLPVQGFDGVSLKVRGTHNDDAVRTRDSILSKMTEEERAALTDDERDAITTEVMAQAILVDWNLEDDSEVAIECSLESRREYLSDPLLGSAMRRAVAFASGVVAERGVAALEADAKN